MTAVRRGSCRIVVAAAVGMLWCSAFWVSFQVTRHFHPGDVAAAEEAGQSEPEGGPASTAEADKSPPASPLESLLAEIVPADGPARPPFLPARYDLGMGPAKPDGPRCPEQLRHRALERQQRLQRQWRKLKAPPPEEMTPDDEAAWKLLAYAFAECELDEALAAARRAGPEARLQLARLLLAESRFEPAVRELASLVEQRGDGDLASGIPARALAMLVAHQQQRAELAERADMLPLGFDLDAFLDRLCQDPNTKALVEALRATARDGIVSPQEVEEVFVSEIAADDPLIADDDPFGDIESGEVDETIRIDPFLSVEELRCGEQPYLVAVGNELALFRKSREPITSGRVELQLFTAFHGPLRFRLYRFPSRADWDQVTGEKLAELEPQRTWTKTYAPLAENNVLGPHEWTVPIARLGEGYYLLTVEARYAPMIGACKFSVSDVALYLRAGRNRGVVVAVDHRTGRPVANLPVELTITGEPDPGAIAERFSPPSSYAFSQGFHGQPARPGSDRSNETSDHLQRARSYQLGVQARKRYPDFHQVRRLSTGKDGSVVFPLDMGRREYRYRVRVVRRGGEADTEDLSIAELAYQEPRPREPRTRAVVWLDQPIHRPGQAVHFKGIVRRFDGVRVAPHDASAAPSVEVEVKQYYLRETVWKGTCEVSAAGTFSGTFRIPETTRGGEQARMGDCCFYVDGQPADPHVPLKIAAYRVPTYRVDLAFPRRTYPGGEDLEGTVRVAYLTGKPAIGAEVEVVLETGQLDPPTVIALTDADGQAAFSLPLPQTERDRQFPVRATVRDASGQSYTQSGTVACTANHFRVDVACAPSQAVHGQPVELKVNAATWAGEPLAGATVIVEGRREALTTDKNGNASIRVNAVGSGTWQQFRVTVAAAGKVVRPAPVSIRLVSKDDPFEPSKKPSEPRYYGRCAWIADCEVPPRIDAGEPLDVTLIVRGPKRRRHTVAVFLENDRMLAHRLLQLPPGKHALTFPTERDWAPSVHVVAVLLEGDGTCQRYDRCYLRPVDKLLTLAVETEKATYKPGERCTAVVTATDHRGQPVAGAEISLGVIDEAVYQLREDPTPDLLDYFYHYYLPRLCDGRLFRPATEAHSVWYWLGPREAWGYFPLVVGYGGHRPMAMRYGGTLASEGGTAPVVVRRRFEEAAHWVADLVTDRDGKARVTFDFPDNITAWRFTARGVTADTRIGEVRARRKTFLPLQIELAVPRGLRAGDRIELPVVLHNNTGAPRTVDGTTRLADAAETPWPSRELGPNADGRFTLPVSADGTGPIRALATIRDRQTGEADAVERTLQPLPAGHPFSRSFSGPLDREVAIPLQIPGPVTEDLTITVRREPGLAGAIGSAIDDLIQYPHGCVEQTMSRFMPAVVAGRAMQRAGIDTPAATRLDEVFDKSIAKLDGYQHDDGGWGWWERDQTNDFMTAYVLEGLALCRSLGRRVPPVMIQSAQAYLAERVSQGKLAGRRPGSLSQVNLTVYASHALATLYQQDPNPFSQRISDLSRALQSFEQGKPSLGLLDEILLADTWRMLGREPRARAKLANLRDRVAVQASSRTSVVTVAALMELGAALEPLDPRWRNLARELVVARRGPDWGDTLTTAAAVRGISAVLEMPTNDAVPVDVLLDGREAGLLSRDADAVLELTAADARELRLKPQGPGCPDFYCVRVSGYLKQPPPPPADPQVTLRTRVFRRTPKREELVPDHSGRLTVPCGVTLEVVLEAALEKPMSHVRLTIPRPCGVELVCAPRHSSGIVAVEEHDDAFHLFVEHWPKGTHELRLLTRAEVPGTVSAPRPELAPMYDDPLPTAIAAPTQWTVGP